MPLLEAKSITVAFGGLLALSDVSFQVEEGSIHGVIGPNGAGKTTLFNVITRLLQPRSGSVRFSGKDLLKVPPHDVVRLGIARTFQNLELCRNQSVLQNVVLGANHRIKVPAWAFALRLPHAHRAESEARTEALELLKLVGCAPYAGAYVQGLPYGVLKRIEFARALATKPRLLILDEPAAGLTGGERERLVELIRLAQSQGITVLLVEHDMSLVMSLCDRITVLDFGKVIAEGSPTEVQDDPAVIAAYLGVEEEGEAVAEA